MSDGNSRKGKRKISKVSKLYQQENIMVRTRKIKNVIYLQSDSNLLFMNTEEDKLDSPVGKIEGKKCTFFKKK